MISLPSKDIEFSQPKSSASSHSQSKSSSISLEVPQLSSLNLLGAARHPALRSTPEIPPPSTFLAPPPAPPCTSPSRHKASSQGLRFLRHGDLALPGRPSPLAAWKLCSHPKCTVTSPLCSPGRVKGPAPGALSAYYTHLFFQAPSP